MKNFPKAELQQLGVKALAIIGFIAILSVGLWGSVQIARLAPSVLSSLAAVATSLTSVFAPAQTITIDTPESIVPTDSVYELSWSHRNKQSDAYTASFTCRDGLSIQSPNTGGIYEEVVCDTPFAFSSTEGTLLIIPLLEGSDFVSVPVTINAVDTSGDTAASGSVTLTISKSGLGAPTGGNTAGGNTLTPGEETTGTYEITNGGTISNPSGLPDLAVHIIGIGIVENDGTFTPIDTLTATDTKAAIRFEIKNIGDKTSDQWTFNAVLPTMPMYIFHSESQQALNPGDKIVFTLEFNQIDLAVHGGAITINADPTGSMKERNEENNIKQFPITVTTE
ncbi:MAG: hypothetical protein OQJ98_01275 [Candidatus Pacebacteria bacterium]|nr:hypothetical protein [Candidatus Paceibacterota bacterium]